MTEEEEEPEDDSCEEVKRGPGMEEDVQRVQPGNVVINKIYWRDNDMTGEPRLQQTGEYAESYSLLQPHVEPKKMMIIRRLGIHIK